jgi:hypothetical protein
VRRRAHPAAHPTGYEFYVILQRLGIDVEVLPGN